MLQAIRNNAQGVFVWIVVGLIVVSFALFGLGSYLSGASKVVAASVNGVEISGTRLTRAYQQYQERLRGMLGEQYRPDLLGSTKQIKTEVLQNLVTEEVMNQMLTDKGYMASSEQVLDRLKQYKEFQEGGKFSPSRYKEVLSIQRINGEAFEFDISREITSKQLRGAISASAFLTAKEKLSLANLQNQKRKVGYFDISVKPYRKLITISDADIKLSYEKNSHLYLTDEKVQVEYLELNMDELAASQEVTSKMITERYETSPENYMANDDAAAKKQMESLRKQIQQGADFAALAKTHSQDKGSAKQGGDLGYLTRGVGDQFDKTIFALKVGEVSQVIKSKLGFQLIQLDNIREGDPEERKVRHILIKSENKLKKFADVKADIKKELQYQLAGKVFFDDADEINNLSYETPDSLEPVAEALGMKLRTSSLITRRGSAGLFANSKVLSAAFSDDVLKQGRNSELLELSDTQLVVLRIKEHKPSVVRALDKVKLQIKDALLREQTTKKAQEVATDVLTRAQNNESVKDIQNRYPEIKWNKSNWVTRKGEKKDDLSPQLRQHIFAMAKPAANANWSKLNLTAGNNAVIALFKVESVKEELADESRITQVLGNADYESFVQHIKSQADISVSQAAIDAEAATNQ